MSGGWGEHEDGGKEGGWLGVGSWAFFNGVKEVRSCVGETVARTERGGKD